MIASEREHELVALECFNVMSFYNESLIPRMLNSGHRIFKFPQMEEITEEKENDKPCG
jgi:hypothetical protein